LTTYVYGFFAFVAPEPHGQDIKFLKSLNLRISIGGNMVETLVAPEVAPVAGESQIDAFQRGFDKGPQPAVIPEVVKVEPSEAIKPQPEVKPAPVEKVVEKLVESTEKPVMPAPATFEKQTREERVDEKRPDDPAALAHWNRWKTATGLVEKEKARATMLEAKTQTLEAELAKERTVKTVAPPAPIDDVLDSMEEKYMDAFTEGNRDEAKKIRREINALNAKEVMGMIGTQTTKAIADDRAWQSVESVGAEAYKKYPALNIDSENADMDAIIFVQGKTQYYLGQKISGPEALRKAVEDAGPRFFPETQETAVLAVPEIVKSPIDEASLRSMAPVQVKKTPIKMDQKPKGDGSFLDGFNTVRQ